MDRDDQDMVNWYHDIIKEAAKNQLLVNFHGAYKPDGIIRTYPNMITREGVMGNEYNRFSKKPLTQTHHPFQNKKTYSNIINRLLKRNTGYSQLSLRTHSILRSF